MRYLYMWHLFSILRLSIRMWGYLRHAHLRHCSVPISAGSGHYSDDYEFSCACVPKEEAEVNSSRVWRRGNVMIMNFHAFMWHLVVWNIWSVYHTKWYGNVIRWSGYHHECEQCMNIYLWHPVYKCGCLWYPVYEYGCYMFHYVWTYNYI